MKMFHKPLNDPFFASLKPAEWLWMYYQWDKDQEEEQKKMQQWAILIGSFSDPAAAKKMLKIDNPDFESDEELHQKTLEELKCPLPEKKELKKKRKKKVAIREVGI
jgi:hypothetical protein